MIGAIILLLVFATVSGFAIVLVENDRRHEAEIRQIESAYQIQSVQSAPERKAIRTERGAVQRPSAQTIARCTKRARKAVLKLHEKGKPFDESDVLKRLPQRCKDAIGL